MDAGCQAPLFGLAGVASRTDYFHFFGGCRHDSHHSC